MMTDLKHDITSVWLQITSQYLHIQCWCKSPVSTSTYNADVSYCSVVYVLAVVAMKALGPKITINIIMTTTLSKPQRW